VPELNLLLNTLTLDVKGHHLVGPFLGTIGLSFMKQKNETLAEEALIPGFDILDAAGYLYEEAALKSLTFSAGLRFDTRNFNVDENTALAVREQTRNYRAVVGSFGTVWRVAEPLAFALNVGRGWRAPTAFELFVNGVHEGTVRFEIGDENLKTEASLNVDFSLQKLPVTHCSISGLAASSK
jgi:iron complex outermembrane receptor protein